MQTCELRHSRNHAMSGLSASLVIAPHSQYPVRKGERDTLMYVATHKSGYMPAAFSASATLTLQ